jgi:hypothetical protein
MIQRASCVGELVVRILSRERAAEITRVFSRSAYLRAGGEFLLLLWGGVKSPMTVNILQGKAAPSGFKVGEVCELGPHGIEGEELTIDVFGTEVHRGSLLRKRRVLLPDTRELVKGVAMLKSLYGVSAHGPKLIDDSVLRAMVDETLAPFASGESRTIWSFQSYRGLLGRGGGFTPAGDDFVSGFVGAFNYIARCEGSETIVIPRDEALSSTVPESGAIVLYSSKGYVDEGMERLILRSLGGREFHGELLALASRGHTSGIDMSLGVILCEAAVAERRGRVGSLGRCTDVLWGS